MLKRFQKINQKIKQQSRQKGKLEQKAIKSLTLFSSPLFNTQNLTQYSPTSTFALGLPQPSVEYSSSTFGPGFPSSFPVFPEGNRGLKWDSPRPLGESVERSSIPRGKPRAEGSGKTGRKTEGLSTSPSLMDGGREDGKRKCAVVVFCLQGRLTKWHKKQSFLSKKGPNQKAERRNFANKDVGNNGQEKRGKEDILQSSYKSNKILYNFKNNNKKINSFKIRPWPSTSPKGSRGEVYYPTKVALGFSPRPSAFGFPQGILDLSTVGGQEDGKLSALRWKKTKHVPFSYGERYKLSTSPSLMDGPRFPSSLRSTEGSGKTGKQNFIKYNLETYHRSNQDTCLIQKPAVKEGDWIQTGDLLADSASSIGGELAIGHNIIVAYMPWEGYNYEDAILINERLVYEDIYTSIHIERYEILTKDTKLGFEQITREIPDANENEISHLDKNGIAKIGSWVEEGDILVGKITPFNIKTLTPQQKLLYKIFDKELSTTKDSSLRAPKGIKANVIKVNILARQKLELNSKETSPVFPEVKNRGSKMDSKKKKPVKASQPSTIGGKVDRKTKTGQPKGRLKTKSNINKKILQVPSYVHIYLAEKRKMQVGDKMAGRHGNKGIVSRILPRQDMPFLPDGTPVDIVLNPLGVPSRMNVGQIYECLLGLAGRYLGEHYKIPPFDEMYGADASRSFVLSKLYDARKKTGLKWLFDPNNPGKIRLFDGRNSDCFDQTVTVGIAYVLKLVHMVDDKMHARSTGPYSLVTQQPLRGRSKQGGQRLGEMEVWAIEGYGAAFVLSEMLTIKSDDMTGRQNLWKNLIENNDISLGSPESFKVLVCELQALCLDIGLFRKNVTKQEKSVLNPNSLTGTSTMDTADKENINKSFSAPNLIEIDSLLHLA